MKRNEMIHATKLDVADWKKITDEDEKAKAVKKMRMFYGHLCMWDEKMTEIRNSDKNPDYMTQEELDKRNVIDDPLSRADLNRRKDKDFVYF